ncbi:pyridoxamine 5'-phosphate oxidase-domain-containing protein [Triangularia setosa]|uniref:Pyridoxamine 5'-phosphate oxidase-domain-containing protein n=1 Tax=Triangularia setosa TaxID=2587417 RepID=A0AAN7ACY2_9PEZI|nr:pyridoxamine 5'-phosphate oxidase-domain-containing protein [Podospora setosa]
MSSPLRRLSTISSHLPSHSSITHLTTRTMSSSPPPAPWREPFTTHLTSLQPPIFTLATLHPVPSHLSPSPSIPVLPRARTCVFRGFFGSLPPNSRNPAPLNPPIYTSDLLALTTDARMSKTSEIFDTAGGDSQTASGGPSGGGGPVEAVFWVDKTKTQWRVRGTAWVLGPDVDGESDGARKVRSVLQPKMRKTDGEGKEQDWSFGREVTAHFGNLSPVMRGSFRGPEPGAPMDYHQERKLGETLEDLGDGVARKNFRVVVIVPEEVDMVDLSEETRPRRWLYTYRGAGKGEGAKLAGGKVEGEWEVVELWP